MSGKRHKEAALGRAGLQFAALPYRATAEGLEVLLVTSRRSRRWIVPKGWPIAGLAPAACAAREASEEAGVRGKADKDPLGHFHYVKYHKKGGSEPCTVALYPLKVTAEEKTWPEQHQRERRWCPVAEAADAVEEPELRALILDFGARANGG